VASDDVARLHEEPVRGIRRENGTVVVALAGELDLYNAQPVRQALAEAVNGGIERVVVDLSDVTFIDSTAMGVLIEARSRLADRSAFVLASPGLETMRALQVSGLDRHFTIRDTVADAVGREP
jgi:anti-anti-sigma factor